MYSKEYNSWFWYYLFTYSSCSLHLLKLIQEIFQLAVAWFNYLLAFHVAFMQLFFAGCQMFSVIYIMGWTILCMTSNFKVTISNNIFYLILSVNQSSKLTNFIIIYRFFVLQYNCVLITRKVFQICRCNNWYWQISIPRTVIYVGNHIW